MKSEIKKYEKNNIKSVVVSVRVTKPHKKFINKSKMDIGKFVRAKLDEVITLK